MKTDKVEVPDVGSFIRCAVWDGPQGQMRDGELGAEPDEENEQDTNAIEGVTMTRSMKFDQFSAGEPAEVASDELGGLFDGYGYYGEVSPAWGALLGAGLAGGGLLAAKAMRHTHPRVAKYAGFIALASGGIPSAIALFFRKTRSAGFLGLGLTAVIAVTELIRGHYVEPEMNGALGEYAAEMAGADLQILGGADDTDMVAQALVAGALGEPSGLQIMGGGQMSIGLYADEMAGAHESTTVSPYQG
jgi:hypothetical protein